MRFINNTAWISYVTLKKLWSIMINVHSCNAWEKKTIGYHYAIMLHLERFNGTGSSNSIISIPSYPCYQFMAPEHF